VSVSSSSSSYKGGVLYAAKVILEIFREKEFRKGKNMKKLHHDITIQ